ncbi:MAG: pyridoxal-5'-phosphate-dependent protein subunit beta, partial [Candidatus Nanoarchaeia archaeon]|nr:pyridoxal-5'-phosphate-dependent protein subunit beta [Candidatus Nanoarchaeia archaeon]
MREGARILERLGMKREAAESMRDLFGVSGMCNVIAAVRMARYLRLGPDENVVTVATDGFDRYESVIDDLDRRCLETTDHVLERWVRDTFAAQDDTAIHDVRRAHAKERLFAQKEKDWTPFGYSVDYLNGMKSQDFWEDEYAKYAYYNEKIGQMRG